MRRRRGASILMSIDWITVGIYLLLVIMGWLNIYAAVYNEEHQSILSVSQRYGKQLLWIGVAIVFIVIPLLVLDSKVYPAFSYYVYVLIIIALAAVLLFGTKVHGARSWFEITETFRLQPSEFAKFATALALAKFMSSYDFKLFSIKNILDSLKNIAISLTIIVIPSALILLQPDLGSAAVYFVFIFVLYREGLPGIILLAVLLTIILFITTLIYKLIVVLIAVFILAFLIYIVNRKSLKEGFAALFVFGLIGGILWILNFFLKLDYGLDVILIISLLISFIFYLYKAYQKKIQFVYFILIFLLSSISFIYSVDYIFYEILEPHQRTRINVFLGVEEDPQGTGYNVRQSKIAIGSGGTYGKGFLQGTQTKYDFVPEQDTDFIFCTVGEEWGFVGVTVVISLFLFFLLRIIYLAERQRSVFSRVYGYAVASILFFHVSVNIGMTIGLVPVVGIPLPFFSYGGSSLWSFTVLVFIFIRLDASRDELL